MFSTGKRIAALGLDLAKVMVAVRELKGRVDKHDSQLAASTPAALRAELDDLRAAIDLSRTALRKELGSLWARVGRTGGAQAQRDLVDDAAPAANDPDFDALLKLQGTPPVKPE